MKAFSFIVGVNFLMATSLQAAEFIQCTTVGWSQLFSGSLSYMNQNVDCKTNIRGENCGKLVEFDPSLCSSSATEIVCKLPISESNLGFHQTDTLTINRKTGDALNLFTSTKDDFFRTNSVNYSNCKKIESSNKL